jgi:hypothetical protein
VLAHSLGRGDAGAMRARGLLAQLPGYGWRVTAITSVAAPPLAEGASLPHSSRVVAASEPAPGRAALARIQRAGEAAGERFVAWPDESAAWSIGAFRAALSTFRAERPAALVSLGPPMTAHLVALALRRRTGIPWIAGFEHGWATGAQLARTFALQRKGSHRVESIVARECDRVLLGRPGLEVIGIDFSRTVLVPPEDVYAVSVLLDELVAVPDPT